MILLILLGTATVVLAVVPWVVQRARAVGWTDYSEELPKCREGEDVVVDIHERIWVACSGLMENVIYVLSDGQWKVSWRGVPLGVVYESGDSDLRDVGLIGLSAGPDGRVWAAHEKAISVFDGGQWNMLRPPESLVGLGTGREIGPMRPPFWPHLGAIAVDQGGRVWVGTWAPDPEFEQGLTASVGVFDGRGWKVYTSQNSGLPRGRAVNEITPDNNGRVWIALADGPLSLFDGSTWTIVDDMKDVTALAIDRFGRVWARKDGLFYHAGNRWIRAVAGEPWGACCSPQHGIVFDARDRVWALTFGTVTVLDSESQTILKEEISGLRLDHERPEAIATDRKGRIWIARPGVQSFDASTRRLTLPGGLVSLKRVWPFAPAITAALWVVLLLRSLPAVSFPSARPAATKPQSVAWFRWILATILGFSVGGLIGLTVGALILARCTNDCDIWAAMIMVGVVNPSFFLFGGTLAAIFQERLVLRDLLARSGRWVAVSAVGFAAVLISLLAIQLISLGPLGGAATFILNPGLAVGIMQWKFLRSHVHRAWWWIVACFLMFGTVWWFLAIQVVPLKTLMALGWQSWLALVVICAEILSLGVFIGALSAATLAALLRQPTASIGAPTLSRPG